MLMKRSTLFGTSAALRVGSNATIRLTGTPARFSFQAKCQRGVAAGGMSHRHDRLRVLLVAGDRLVGRAPPVDVIVGLGLDAGRRDLVAQIIHLERREAPAHAAEHVGLAGRRLLRGQARRPATGSPRRSRAIRSPTGSRPAVRRRQGAANGTCVFSPSTRRVPPTGRANAEHARHWRMPRSKCGFR